MLDEKNNVVKVDDMVKFDSNFIGAKVIPSGLSKVVKGDKAVSIGGKEYCSAGSEGDVQGLIEPLKNCVYTTKQYTNPGMGTLDIKALDSSQLSDTCEISSNKKAILKGSEFKAVFTVGVPASDNVQPKPNFDTPQNKYDGKGKFLIINSKFQAK